MTRTGILYIISAASGAGKTSLVKALVANVPDLRVSVSYTTRHKRPQEENDVNYHFVSNEAFEKLLEQDIFLEHAIVFGHNYGTSRPWVENELKQGRDVILEIDWQGARQIRQKMPETLSIFILPPSLEVLRNRLNSRAQDDQSTIEHRMAQAQAEMSHYPEYDYVIINDTFEQAVADLTAIIYSNRLRLDSQAKTQASLIEKLLPPA